MLVSEFVIQMIEGDFRHNGSGGGLRGLGSENSDGCVEMTSDIAMTPGSKIARVPATAVPGLCEVIVSEGGGRERRC